MKQALITGATSGIGTEIARNLLNEGFQVLILARNASRADQVCSTLHHATANPQVDYVLADLAHLKAVQSVIGPIQEKTKGIDVLINNAGLMTLKREVSKDGYELVMAVNHLAVMLLTDSLVPHLRDRARIINVNSVAHNAGNLKKDLNLTEGWKVSRSYGNSKLANLLYTYHLAKKLRSVNTTVNAVHPGVVGSSFGNSWGGFLKYGWKVAKPFMLTPAQGAKTPTYLAVSSEVEGISSKYFKNNRIKRSSALSYNEDLAKRVMEQSYLLIKKALE